MCVWLNCSLTQLRLHFISFVLSFSIFLSLILPFQARGGNNLNLNTGTGTGNNCTTRKGAFHLPSTMVTGSLCGSEAPGAGSSLTSPSIMYSSSSANCNSKGTSANATGGAKGRTGWPEHVWELELKNGTGDPNVGTLVACGVATSCINSSGGSDESGILSNIGWPDWARKSERKEREGEKQLQDAFTLE